MEALHHPSSLLYRYLHSPEAPSCTASVSCLQHVLQDRDAGLHSVAQHAQGFGRGLLPHGLARSLPLLISLFYPLLRNPLLMLLEKTNCSLSQATTHDRSHIMFETAGMPHSFIVASGPFTGCTAIPLTVSLVPIYQANEKSCPALSQPQLVALSAKALARGFSRTLQPTRSPSCPPIFSVSAAFDHTSREGFRNVRLMLTVGPHVKDLHTCFLNVTHKEWQAVRSRLRLSPARSGGGPRRLVG